MTILFDIGRAIWYICHSTGGPRLDVVVFLCVERRNIMAIEKQNQASVLKVKVGTGTSAMGATTYTVRTVADINPALTDADLFAILYTLDQTLEADATAWTGINTVCIACRPSAETRITQRIGGPAINCPT